MSRRGPNGELRCSLVRKRCKCGKQVKAIQLTRYGSCDDCIKAAAMALMMPDAANDPQFAGTSLNNAASPSTKAE